MRSRANHESEIQEQNRERFAALLQYEDVSKSFAGAFYGEPFIFDIEQNDMLDGQWIFAAHASEFSQIGSCRILSILGESVIVVRAAHSEWRAYYNVCRHRGSALLDGSCRAASHITCPYHGWTYDLEGRLISAPNYGRTPNVSLQALGVLMIEGMIFVCLNTESPASTQIMEDACRSMFTFHGLSDAKIATQTTYIANANWKLVTENFLECYHCRGNHPQLCQVYDHVLVSGSTAADDARRYSQSRLAFSARAHALNAPLVSPYRLDPSAEQFAVCFRMGIKTGFDTLSQNGRPIAPLMGDQTRYDGGETFGFVGPFLHFSIANDHAVLICVRPLKSDATCIHLNWLVRSDAEEGSDYHCQQLRWLWDNTVRQDIALVERVQSSFRSRAYQPLAYGALETDSQLFKRWYLNRAQAALNARFDPAD